MLTKENITTYLLNCKQTLLQYKYINTSTTKQLSNLIEKSIYFITNVPEDTFNKLLERCIRLYTNSDVINSKSDLIFSQLIDKRYIISEQEAYTTLQNEYNYHQDQLDSCLNSLKEACTQLCPMFLLYFHTIFKHSLLDSFRSIINPYPQYNTRLLNIKTILSVLCEFSLCFLTIEFIRENCEIILPKEMYNEYVTFISESVFKIQDVFKEKLDIDEFLHIFFMNKISKDVYENIIFNYL
jgi:hypothetical protein